jgi:hypothetical protein
MAVCYIVQSLIGLEYRSGVDWPFVGGLCVSRKGSCGRNNGFADGRKQVSTSPKKTQYEREISPREQHPETLADARDAREVLGEIHQRRLASLRLGHALDGRHLKVAPRPRVCLLNEVGELMVACLTPLERLTRICWIVKRLAGSFSSTWSSQSPHKYAWLPAR